MNGTKLLKYALIGTDLLILITGLTMLIAGSGTHLTQQKQQNVEKVQIKYQHIQ